MSTQIKEQETETEAETETEETSEHQTRRLSEKRERADMRERAETELSDTDETVRLKVFRYDPEVEGKKDPRFDTFEVPFTKGMTILDSLIYARDHFDSSLTFRHSCRQAICGSDALFVNGRQRLGCKTQMADLEWPVRIEPLPHAEVVKDLVVDLEHFYDQMEAVEPYFQTNDLPSDGEQRQSRENREKVKMSTRCIWCSACMSSCNIAAGDNEYLGPAADQQGTGSRWTNAGRGDEATPPQHHRAGTRCLALSDAVLLHRGVSEGHPPHGTHPGAETRGGQEQPQVLVAVV